MGGTDRCRGAGGGGPCSGTGSLAQGALSAPSAACLLTWKEPPPPPPPRDTLLDCFAGLLLQSPRGWPSRVAGGGSFGSQTLSDCLARGQPSRKP